MNSINQALVIFSGGQDSATCLIWALKRFERVHTIGFDYGQRHKIELKCRADILQKLKANPKYSQQLGEDKILNINMINDIGQTAMTSEMEIFHNEKGLPNTFVPGRNLLFLLNSAMWAWRLNCKDIVLGVCETDFSGYPDCRDDAIKAMQVAINIGFDARFALHTPLMWIDKAKTWQMAEAEGGKEFVELIRTDTHSCYLGVRDKLHDYGYGCGTCPACELRKNGYAKYKATA